MAVYEPCQNGEHDDCLGQTEDTQATGLERGEALGPCDCTCHVIPRAVRQFLQPFADFILDDEDLLEDDGGNEFGRNEMSIDDAFQTAFDAVQAIRDVVAYLSGKSDPAAGLVEGTAPSPWRSERQLREEGKT